MAGAWWRVAPAFARRSLFRTRYQPPNEVKVPCHKEVVHRPRVNAVACNANNCAVLYRPVLASARPLPPVARRGAELVAAEKSHLPGDPGRDMWAGKPEIREEPAQAFLPASSDSHPPIFAVRRIDHLSRLGIDTPWKPVV